MRAVLARRNMVRAACLALAAACCACASAGGSGPAGRAGEGGQHGAVITVGSFDFPESVLLADLYAGALAANRFPVRVLPDLGPRELVDPALLSRLIQVVPEYSRSALEFVSVGRLSVTSDAAATSTALAGQVAGRGLVAPRLIFGGPPECPESIYCLRGLRQVYGLRFRAFVPLDAGGPLTLQALEAGYIGVALLFSTDPVITADHLVVLAGDRGLQPAENVVPLARRAVVAWDGPRLLAVLNIVSARLTTGSLRGLDARVQLRGENPRRVAGSWLRAQGLVWPGGASQ
jgi:osmoprotectant transport system substrate-binding protein